MNPYDDIINLPHYEPRSHPRMSMESRAAQFASFAALTGYDDAICETARTTEGELVQSADRLDQLNQQMELILEHIDEHPTVCVTYFVDDKKKSGGAYHQHIGAVEKIDTDAAQICFSDYKKISFASIVDIRECTNLAQSLDE